MRRCLVTFALTIVAIVATVVPSVSDLLIDRLDAFAIHQPWRLFTGHFVHASATHLIFDLMLFVPLLAILERRHGSWVALGTTLFLGLGVALGIRVLHTGWTTYAGLSGVVYGLIPVALLLTARLSRLSILVVIAVTVKTGLECLGDGWLVSSASLSELFEVRYLAGSHLAGLAVGLGIVVIHRTCRTAALPEISPSPNDAG